jgi:hypothetical protein
MAKLTPAQKAQMILTQRERSDPLRWFVPSPTQEQFLRRDTKETPFCLVNSLSRGGKSAITMADLAMTLRGIHPYQPKRTKLVIAVFAPTREQACRVIGHKLFDDSELMLPADAPDEARGQPMIPSWEIEHLRRPMVAGMKVPKEVIMKNGNSAFFSWTGVEGQDKRIAGIKLDAAYIDEEAGNSRLFAEIATRLTDSLSQGDGLGYYVWAYTNTNWNDAYEEFKQRQANGAPGHRTFLLMPGENPAISAAARRMVAGTMNADEAAIRMEGGTDAGSLVQIYGKQWQDERHVMKTAYEIQPEDNLWVSYDPGVEHPMGMLVAAVNKQEPMCLNFTQAWMYKGETIEKDVDNLVEYLRGRRLTGFVYDTNLKNKDRGGGPSVLTRMKELMASRGVVPLAGFFQSKKNHAPGIALVRHYLDPSDRRDCPPLIRLSKPTDSNGLGIFRAQMIAYRGKESTKFTGPGGVVKKSDETPDCCRYLCMQRPSWNPDWACGRALNIPTQRVAFLDATGTIPVPQRRDRTVQPPRFDFATGVYRSRDRRKARASGWMVEAF